LGYGRSTQQPKIGDLVICLNPTRFMHSTLPPRFVGLVLDKAITVCKIQVVDSGRTVYWPLEDIFLWKETK